MNSNTGDNRRELDPSTLAMWRRRLAQVDEGLAEIAYTDPDLAGAAKRLHDKVEFHAALAIEACAKRDKLRNEAGLLFAFAYEALKEWRTLLNSVRERKGA